MDENSSILKNEEFLKDNSLLNVFLIESNDELISFLLEVLDLEDVYESEEELMRTEPSSNIMHDLLHKILPFTAIVEDNYVDRFYRDSYYLHYSCKHENYSSFCKRLFIFQGDIFAGTEAADISDLKVNNLQKKLIGIFAIRPLRVGKIGRSLVNPKFVLEDNSYLRYAEYSATVAGMRFFINAFPFSMQDGETTTCAEISILNLMDYYGSKYSEYKSILPSEIAEIAKRYDFERVLPSRGLKYSTITRVFSELGFHPRLYTFDDPAEFKRVMHYYVESGIPLALGVKNAGARDARHSIICIGHRKTNRVRLRSKLYGICNKPNAQAFWMVDTADLCSEYIVMDDGKAPYNVITWVSQSAERPGKPDCSS